MQLDESIFKAYDVRGVYPTQLNEEIAEKMGKAFAVFIKQQVGKEEGIRVAMGRDTRLSSPQLFEAAIAGILAQGVDVDDIGLVSADVMYFTVGHQHLTTRKSIMDLKCFQRVLNSSAVCLVCLILKR